MWRISLRHIEAVLAKTLLDGAAFTSADTSAAPFGFCCGLA